MIDYRFVPVTVSEYGVVYTTDNMLLVDDERCEGAYWVFIDKQGLSDDDSVDAYDKGTYWDEFVNDVINKGGFRYDTTPK